MSVPVLLRHLWWPSAVNRVRWQVKRLRNPRYLVATALGAAYWFWYLGGRVMVSRGGHLDATLAPAVELGLCVVALGAVVLSWVFASDRAALSFSEAEIQFLFPAPLGRRTLLDYRLARSLVTGLVGAVVTTLLFGRRLGNPVFFTVGSWLALTAVSWHALGASLTRARLAERGIGRGARRLLSFVPVLAYLGAIAWAVSHLSWPELDLDPSSPRSLLPLVDLGRTGLLGALLAPIRALVHLALASDTRDFLASLPAALAVVGLHYLWVATSATRFEEGSLELAVRRATRVAARQSGGAHGRPRMRRRPPFALRVGMPVEVALAWRGLIAGHAVGWVRGLALRAAAFLGLLVVLELRLIPGLSATGVDGIRGTVLGLALFAVGLMTLVGPTFMRFDLRQDLVNVEALRALPISGRQLVVGEMAGPALFLLGELWVAVLVAVCASGGRMGFGLDQRIALGLGVAVLAPPIAFAGLVVQNTVAVVLPAWVQLGPERPTGPEASGMRMLVLLGNVLAVGLAMIPAVVAGGIAGALLWGWLGLWIAPVAGGLAAAVLLGEIGVAVHLLGRGFERWAED